MIIFELISFLLRMYMGFNVQLENFKYAETNHPNSEQNVALDIQLENKHKVLDVTK